MMWEGAPVESKSSLTLHRIVLFAASLGKKESLNVQVARGQQSQKLAAVKELAKVR